MTGKQLGRIISKIIYWYDNDVITDKQVEEIIDLLPTNVLDLLYALQKKEVYFEKSEDTVYIEIHEDDDVYKYELDYGNTDIEEGQIYLIKKKKEK